MPVFLNKEQRHYVLLYILESLNQMKPHKVIYNELIKEPFLKEWSYESHTQYVHRARNLSYGLALESTFTPTMNVNALLEDMERARKLQKQIMEDDSEDQIVRLKASEQYQKSSIDIAKIRRMVPDALRLENGNRPRQAIIQTK